MKITKKTWMQIHTYLSLFFLPAALIYAITGALYIFEIRQNSGAQTWKFELESMPQKGKEQEVILQILKNNNLKIPSNTEVRNFKGGISMGNVKYSAFISKDPSGKVIMNVIDRNLYGVLMMMHKSGGTKFELGGFRFSFFDFIVVGFGVSLLLFYLSGLFVTSFCKKNRLSAFGTLGVGFIITALAIYWSV
ncbi:hypothetical protein [Helicobacter fennelliae]|uniref:Putative integral membrane protein n=1 Tax=Helicobacter fennelliae MRY12-0050 TaxID=1325130 RepID=T1DUL7_9HELI|nr:hypothetical protein [Helicobacter fennelliae]GAD17988.1 putative integral membrane protein [Helicobacter fennelliae MRY12-0050]